MFVSSIGVNKVNNAKATKIGSAAGVGVGAAYLLKNKEDIFIQRAKESMAKYGTKKYGIISAAIVATGTLLATTGIGAMVGNIIDKIKFKKQETQVKQMLAEVLQKGIDEKNVQETTSMDELLSLQNEIQLK